MKKNKLFNLILMFIVLSFSLVGAGSAFAYHSTIEVSTTKNGHTLLKFMSKKGLRISINVAKNGTIIERYRQVVKQVKNGKNDYTNFYRAELAKINILMKPGQDKILFGAVKRFGAESDGVLYSYDRVNKVIIQPVKMLPSNHFKSGKSFSSPEVQNLIFKFNYPQSKSGNFYSKLIKFAKVPGKNQYNIVFSAVDGLEYSILTSANAKQILISIITNKLKTNLFGISLNEGYSIVELMNPDSKKKKGEIAFIYKNSAPVRIHIIGHNNTNLYYNFKNFK